jgi:hypothetical protein
MDRSIFIENFHKQADEFLKKMMDTFKELTVIGQYYGMYKMMKKLPNGEIKTIELLMTGLEPYGQQIMTRDEHFFKDDQFVGTAENLSGQLGLVKIWDSIDQTTKDAIWDYIKVLYILGLKSLGKS